VSLTILQPHVNPAFGPLFWLGLEWDIDTSKAAEPDLGEALGAMAYDMLDYPASRAEAAKVRDAQVQLVHEHFEPELHEGKWRYADEAAWTAHCDALFQEHKAFNVFAHAYDNGERLKT
jgi:hypothetical protein